MKPRTRHVVEHAVLKAAAMFIERDLEDFDGANRRAVIEFRARVAARAIELEALGQPHDTAAAVAAIVDAKAIAADHHHPTGRLDADAIAGAILASGKTTRGPIGCA